MISNIDHLLQNCSVIVRFVLLLSTEEEGITCFQHISLCVKMSLLFYAVDGLAMYAI
jgi:hypothetical protein